jgi:prophage regulatory protein
MTQTDQITPQTGRGRRGATALAAHGQTDTSPMSVQPDRIVREPECAERTGLSRSTRWRLERRGRFPRKRQLSPGCRGWLESELAAWIAAR